MGKQYPSDISREQFEIIKPILESARKKTKPREVDLHEVFCAVLYILKTACQWRMLPSDFPKWQTVYSYFRKWKHKPDEFEDSILEEVLKKIGKKRAYQEWEKWSDYFLHNRFSEREEY